MFLQVSISIYITLWVHFNIRCHRDTQIILHSIFRQNIIDWERTGLIQGAVLTYHFQTPRSPRDSLYVCLDIPSVKEPETRTPQLTDETMRQIPQEILNSIKMTCEENGIAVEYDAKKPPENRLISLDYEYNQRRSASKLGSNYYHGASVDEVLKFASVGTKIAIQILSTLENDEHPWKTDKELALYIVSRLREELGDSYPWIDDAFHFVSNPLLVNEIYLRCVITNRINVIFPSSELNRLLKHAKGE